MSEMETATGRVIVDADGRALRGTFPRSWGRPPDDLEERRTWISRNIELGNQRLDRGEKAESQKPRTGRQAMAALALKRAKDGASPAEVNHIRARLLELKREGPQ